MNLPNLESLLSEFSSFLLEAKLSSISIKNYLSDLRHFVRYCQDKYPTVNIREVFQSLSKYVNSYTENQKSIFTPTSSLNRRLASVRRFETFLRTHHNIFEYNQPSETDQNISLSQNHQSSFDQSVDDLNKDLTTKKVLDLFKTYLQREKKTHSTVKNYLSDLYHFFAWIAKETPFTARNLDIILSDVQLTTYISYLKLTHTSVSVINRRTSSIKKLAHFCFLEKFISTDPFEKKIEVVKLSPISWFRRFIPKPTSPSNAPKNRLAVIYDKYHALPFTPYLHLALLVLATTTMAFLGYNQIIKQAKPSSAATTLTPPKRQLSFQGRLQDSTGTPITTATNLIFKLYNVGVGGTAIYNSGTCSIDPDQDGIFNTLIGDGTCGAEITQSVFSDNRDVYLELTVGAETLTPRQQIATVGYALNSETLQGYPAANPATINSVPVFDNSGNLNIGITSPSLVSTSGTFSLKGQALSLTTTNNSGGDIILQPDALGSGQIQAIGGGTAKDTIRITNANLTDRALISGYVGNDTATGDLLRLSAGSTETKKFAIGVLGQLFLEANSSSAAAQINQAGSGDLFTASASGVTKLLLTNAGNLGIGTTNPSYKLDVNGSLGVGGSTTFGGITYSWPATQTTDYVLKTNGSGVLSWVAQSAGTGDITAVGSMTSGDAFADSTADDDWLGLGATGGRIEFDDQATDEVNILDANVGIGTTSPAYKLDVIGAVNLGTGNSFSIGGASVLSANVLGVGVTSSSLVQVGALTSGSIATGFGNINIGNSITTTSMLTGGLLNVGTGPSFQVTAGGDIAMIRGVGYTFPSAQGGASTVLTNDGAGNLSWGTATAGIGGSGTANYIPKWSAGTTLANSLLYDTGTAIGIGTTAPGYLLDVAGSLSSTSYIQAFTGTTGIGISITANSLTTGSALALNTSSTGLNGDYVSITTGVGSTAGSSFNALKVGIGSTAGTGTAVNITNAGSGTSFRVNDDGTYTDTSPFLIDASGNVGIGTTAPGYTLDVVGAVNLGTGNSFSIGGTSVLSVNVLGVGVTSSSLVQVGALTSGSIATGFGNINIGNSITTTSMLTGGLLNVGTGNSFQVDASGDIVKIKGVTYSWPTSIPSNDYVLQAQTNGTLAWVAQSAGTGDITAVGSMTSGDAFADSTADDDWLGLGATAGRIEFDDQATDEVNILDANVGIGTTAPGSKLEVAGTLTVSGSNLTSLGGNLTVTGTAWTATPTISGLITATSGLTANSTLTANAGIVIGDNIADTVTVNSGAWTIANDTNLALTGGTNGLSFDTSTLSIDATADRVGIGTTAPGYTLDVVGAVNLGTGNSFSIGGTSVLSANVLGVGVTSSSLASLGTLINLNVGTGNSFQVDASGDIVKIKGVTYSWPTSNSAGVLTNNGTGTLSWGAAGVGGTGITNYIPKWSSSSALANSLLYDTGTAIGIGTTAPGYTLDVIGAVNLGTGNSFSIGGTSVLSANVLGVGVTSSSLVQVGALTSGSIATGFGNINIGNSITTTSMLTGGLLNVGTGPSFQVNASGDIVKIKGLTYSWPVGIGASYASLRNDGSGNLSWVGVGSTGSLDYWTRTTASSIGYVTPSTDTDKLVIGGSLGVGITAPGGSDTAIYLMGSASDIIPENPSQLGSVAKPWSGLWASSLGITTVSIDIDNQRLTNGQWNIFTNDGTDALGIGTSNSNTSGWDLYVQNKTQLQGNVGIGHSGSSDALYVSGTSTITSNLSVGSSLTVTSGSYLIGNVTIGVGGTGKLDVGTVDPPYTINGEKYATYLTSMVGVKEEVTGNIYTSQFVDGVGYRTLIDLDQQPKGSDIWLFSKTTDINKHINKLSVLLTGEGQTKTWYELDKENKILAIYSSSPTNISYRLTAPRFDADQWQNTRDDGSSGFIINDSNNNQNFNSQFDRLDSPNLIAQLDGTYKIISNDKEIQEVSSFKNSLIANLKAGIAVVNEIVVDNLTVRQKLITPIADIDQLKVNNATISGTLYADNIKGQTIDRLDEQLDLLSEKYSTASAILADLQAKYGSYVNLTSTPSADPLSLSPLATIAATLPIDLPTDILADSVFTKSINSFDTDLYIQPTGDKPVHLLANLMTLYPDGKVLINGDLLITGTLYASNIDTKTATISGTLALGKGEIATDSSKLMALFNNYGEVVGSVDASGSANFNNLTTPELIIASGNDNSTATDSAKTNTNASIGIASIATDSAEIFISNTKVTDNTLIYITPISDTNNQVLYVKSKQTGNGFTVATPQPATAEYFFNYWLVQTK